MLYKPLLNLTQPRSTWRFLFSVNAPGLKLNVKFKPSYLIRQDLVACFMNFVFSRKTFQIVTQQNKIFWEVHDF